MTQSKLYDVLIIGGGPAGLSMAGALARQVHTALILDSQTYRNDPATHIHNFAGFDHVPPSEYRAKVRADLARHYETIDYKTASITAARKLDSGIFEVEDSEGMTYRGKKLGLGTGMRDVLEDTLPGYAECWGRGIFHCLFCHGYEDRGAESVGILASDMAAADPNMIMMISRMAKRLSKHVTIYTNNIPELAPGIEPLLRRANMTVDARSIASLSLVGKGPQVELSFSDGSKHVEGFLVGHPKMEQRAKHLVEQLGLGMTPNGEIQVTAPWNETSLEGCYAAGDAMTPMKVVVQALQTGGFAGGGLATSVQKDLHEKGEL